MSLSTHDIMNNKNEEFVKELFNYFINDLTKYSANHIIKKHTEKLHEYGDYSFPITVQNWTQYLSSHYDACANIFTYRESQNDLKFQSIADHIQDLVSSSQSWVLQIQAARINETRCSIFLNRVAVFHNTINVALNNPDYGYQIDECGYNVEIVKNDVIPEDEEVLTKYRCRIVRNAIENLMKCSRTEVNSETPCKLYVTHKSTDADAPVGCTRILVGNVTNNENKVLTVPANEYIKKRSLDMQLMAQHKYGLRVRNEKFFQVLVEALGKAAVTIDLLEVKHSCSVKIIMTGCAVGRSKGAAFILYNSARIETLLKKYNHGVTTKFYPETPAFDAVNFALLKEEEEWSLLFNYIFAYPSLLNQVIGEVTKPTFSLHLLCTFLNGLASTFSIYYGRIRILTENRPQLIPTLHARIYLLKCLRIVLNKCLAILNIEPVQQM